MNDVTLSTDPPALRAEERAARRRQKAKRRRWVFGALGFVVVSAVAVAGVLVWRLNANLTVAQLQPDGGTDEISAAITTEIDTAPLDILVLGSDGRDAGEGRFGDDDGTRRSDSMMLVHIAEGNARIDAVQIPRDTVFELPACDDIGLGAFAGGWGMINSAFNYGENCSVQAVEALTGIEIDHVLSLNFDGLTEKYQHQMHH